MIFDGDCAFCRKWILRFQKLTGNRVDYAPFQEVAMLFPEIPLLNFEKAVHLVEPSGVWSQGAEAVFRVLASDRRYTLPLKAYRSLPGVKGATESAYRLVARNRALFSRITRWI